MNANPVYDHPAHEGETEDARSGVRESTELLHRRVESATKVVEALKERLTPVLVNAPRAMPGDDGMAKDHAPPPRSDHASELSKIAGQVATVTATIDDVLQMLDI